MAKFSFKDNSQQTPTSNSATNSNAAKDDAVTLSPTGTFTLADILGNDADSAIFQPDLLQVTGGTGTLEYFPDTETFQVTGEVTSFEYMVRMANGTYSKATVTLEGGDGPVDPQAGDQFLHETFGEYTTSPTYDHCDLAEGGWTGTTVDSELCHYGYLGMTGSAPDGYYLDTQRSPGGIDIAHAVQDLNAGQALISFTAAFPDIDGWIPVNGTLDFLWNGVVVKSISTADFAGGNQFTDFSVVVNSLVENTLQIQHIGIPTNAGFALDSVTVSDWI